MSDLFYERVAPEAIMTVFGTMNYCHRHTFMLLTKRPWNALRFCRDAELLSHRINGARWPENVWLGVTAENQRRADERIPILFQIPAAVRFASIEPMLGPVDLLLPLKRKAIDWVIAGCESGPGRRRAEYQWFRDLRDQCVAANVPFFLKQMDGQDGGWNSGKLEKMPELDGQVWDQYPENGGT